MAKSGKKGLRDYTLITLDENHVLQLRNDNLIQRVWNSSIFIEEAEAAVKDRDKVKRELAEWKAYIACDPIPKPFEPQEVRKFFVKRSLSEDEEVALNINWRLAVDERSILSQDIDAVNLTRSHLELSKPNFGLHYDTRVNEAMIVARRIEDFLEAPTVVLSKRIMQDVEDVKFASFAQIHRYIDNLTYRVLCSEAAYMNLVDVTTAEYAHQATNFDIHIWTLRNVPIYLNPSDTPTKTIALKKVGVKLVLPFSVLCPNMVVRGLHCHFDHFSAHARFYDLPPISEVEPCLRICLKNEWNTQMKIQAEVKAKMIQQRAEYDEALRLKQEEEEKAKMRKNVKEDDKKPKEKPKKLPKEPLIVTPDLVPVVRLDFLNHDFLEYEAAMLEFHPHTFGLTKGEINLRKYQILGGVYQINCLTKPNVVMLPKLIMGWYISNESTEYKDLHAHLNTTKSQADVSRFFKITFELPECYCLWGQPIPCLFEEGESYRNAYLHDEDTSKGLVDISPVIINDFNLHELFTRDLMYTFLENTIPRLISSFNLPEDLFDEEEDKKSKATLGRAKLTPEEQEREREIARQKQMLSFKVQNCPERLFPLFKKSLPVVILPRDDPEALVNIHPYEYFSDFMEAIKSIETSYRDSKFKTRRGSAIQILAEDYDSNIRRPRMDSKIILYTERESKMEPQPSIQGLTSMRSGSKISLTGSHARTSKMSLTEEKGIAKKKKGSKKKPPKEIIPVEEPIDEELTTNYSKWSTANIIKSEVDTASRKVTIWTDRLGTFGFAFYRYEHFPFKSWTLEPDEENPDEVELKIESAYAIFRINISANGYRLSVTDFTTYIKGRKVYLEIKEPVTDIKILKEQLTEKYLNIFPETDAIWYMTGYFSEKHLSSEYHTYNCMSLYATSLKFRHSIWNKLSNRRTMVLRFGEPRDLDEDYFVLCIRPEDVTFVEIKELCSTLEVIDLEYKPTWRNLEWYPDLNHLITSTYVNWSEMRTQDPNVVYYLKNLLQAIKPLSCS